ncbi:MAG TPA: glycosyltransferase [Gemmatimonadaceae bacterium]
MTPGALPDGATHGTPGGTPGGAPGGTPLASPISPPGPPRFAATLGVVTHVPHWRDAGGAPRAYEPYVREMDVWARLFARVRVCAPEGEGAAPGSLAPYAALNVTWRPACYTMALGARAQLRRLRQMPALAAAITRLARESDLVLLRSPGHPALVGRVIARAMAAPTITKWAGLFDAFEGERVPSIVERHLVRLGRDPALVYGPSPAPHLISFPPALMTRAELSRAAAASAHREWRPPWRVLSVGRLLGVKGFDLALRGLARLREVDPDLDWRYTLVGGGPEESALRALVARSGIADRVEMPGPLPFDAVLDRYAAAHLVIMPGVKEGWPKVIAESWAHGAVPVAAAAGIVPWIMEGKDAGVTFPPDPDSLAATLRTLMRAPARLTSMSVNAQRLVDTLSLESFAERLEGVLVEWCGLERHGA